MGSKARLAKDLKPIFDSLRKSGQVYVEPFAGGMNMLCEMDGPRLGADTNRYLIAMWRALLQGWLPPDYVDRDEYNYVRDNMDAFDDHYVGWVGFNCSYSGKFMAGFAGKTETKEGVRNYQSESIRNIEKQFKKLYGAELFCSDYRDLELPENSLIYCDPPYRGTCGYNSDFDHDGFWDWVREKQSEGHTVLVSEYSAPEDFICMWEKKVKSSLSANGKSGGSQTSTEKLFY